MYIMDSGIGELSRYNTPQSGTLFQSDMPYNLFLTLVNSLFENIGSRTRQNRKHYIKTKIKELRTY